MIWILTLCLLAVAAWLFFNALNERRWVDAHSHDETVASDEGLLAGFTGKTRTAQMQGDGKISIDQENSGFARAVSVVQEKTAKMGEKLESKIASARMSDSDRPASAGEENTLFGRVVAKVGAKAASIDDKLDTKMKAAAVGATSSAGDDGQGGTFFERTSRKVTQRSEEITQRVAHRAKVAADNYEESHRSGNGEAGGIESEKQKAERRRAAKKAQDAASSEDIVTRVSNKVGNKINEIDGKIVDAGKKAVD